MRRAGLPASNWNSFQEKRSSRKSIKRTIGLIVPKVAHPFFSEAIEAIYDEAHQRSYDVFMMVSGEDAALEAHHVKTLLGLQVDGFLISVTERTTDLSPFESILSKNKKLVFFDRIKEKIVVPTHLVINDTGRGQPEVRR